MMNLTEVFPHTIKPVRSGIYLTRSSLNKTGGPRSFSWSYFDAPKGRWAFFRSERARVEYDRGDYIQLAQAVQNKNWKGLSENPEENPKDFEKFLKFLHQEGFRGVM